MNKTWLDKYSDKPILVQKIKKHKSWKKIFKKHSELLNDINEQLDYCMKVAKEGTVVNIYPYPKLLYNTFKLPLKDINIVILGQDPYHGHYKDVPQAMGLSFSVPKTHPIPSSLRNIYNNMKEYKHCDKIPKHGDLTQWVEQGCMLLNTSLTVQEGIPGSHTEYWEKFTDEIIKYISKKRKNIVFLLWGKHAANKKNLIDGKKHKIIITSHPSGHSFAKPLRSYSAPAFKDFDHFGETNKYLKSKDIKPINWNIK